MVSIVCLSLFFLPFSKTFSETGWIISILLWICLKVRKKELFFPRKVLDVTYLIFLAAVLASLTQLSPGMAQTGWRGLWKWLKYLSIFWMCRDLFCAPESGRRATMVFLLSMALVSLNGIWQMWHGLDLIKGYPIDIPGRLVRMRSSFGSPNDLAAFYLIALPLVFQMWLHEKKWSLRSASLAGLAAIFFICLILTLSRSAFLALCAAVLIFLVTTGRKKLVLVGALFLATFLGFSGLMRENFVTSLNSRDITVGERLRYWRQSWEIIKEKPILGHGANTYYQEFASHASAEETYRGYAHNFILQLWSDLGLAGTILFIFGLIYGFVKKWPGKKEGMVAALWVGLLAFVFQGLLDTNFFAFQTSHLFWFFWAVLLAQPRKVSF